MATKKPEIEQNDDVIWLDDPTTVKVADKQQKYTGPTVTIYLPSLEEEGSGVKVDQYEHVTIANEDREQHWKIRRGTYVDVPVPVYAVLKESGRYPNL